MTPTPGTGSATSTRPSRAMAGSLAAALAGGSQPTALLFPGADARWPQVLSDALAGRPALANWVAAVERAVDAWARTPGLRATGAFADGFSTRVADPGPAGTGPAILPGSVVAELACLQALEDEGLAVIDGSVRVVAQGVGLLAACAAGATRDEDGLVPVEVAVQAVQIAAVLGIHLARHPWAVSGTAVGHALAGQATAATPMVAIEGVRTAVLRAVLAILNQRLGTEVAISATRSATSHVLTGPAEALTALRQALQAKVQADARTPGPSLRFTWQPVPCAVPLQHPALAEVAQAASQQIADLGLALPGTSPASVLDAATGGAPADRGIGALVQAVVAQPSDWAAALAALPARSVALLVAPLGSLSDATGQALGGRGVLLLDPATPKGREGLFTPGRAPAMPVGYDRYAPRVVRTPEGGLRLDTKHTRLTGRSPMILPGMTPTTSDARIVAAAANGGHVAELAGGGQVNERIFWERVRELTELLAPGQEVVLNTLHLDPYLWGLHVGRDRLLQRARAAGAPFNGLTVSAGIPEPAAAVALLDELVDAGLWLNAFKPGTIGQVEAVLEIAAQSPHPVWLHLEGGTAGGHHSWEDLDALLLATYDRIRQHDTVVLAVGGGVGDPARAAALLTGTWAHAHGEVAMPVDAVLLGTATMAALEATTSPSVKRALVAAAGHAGPVQPGKVVGGVTSGRSSLNADIHFLDNSASRTARLLDEVAGDAEAVAARRAEIVEALSRTAKPYFGDLDQMTYVELLTRFVELTALGRHGRYEDGAWLDPTHRSRFLDLLHRAEARLNEQDTGPIPTLFAGPEAVDAPAGALAALLAAYPVAGTALLHPADAAHFVSVCQQGGKPVPFVPVLDADVRRWYQSDALWQSHDDRYDADQVLIIPGPAAVAGITTVDEPVSDLLDRFETQVALTIGGATGLAEFRLGPAAAPAGGPQALLHAALAARTWLWAGTSRRNPLHGIGAPGTWSVDGTTATWSDGGAEAAVLRARSGGSLTLTLTWPDMGLPGDGCLSLPVEVDVRCGAITFAVTAQGLGQAGTALLALHTPGTGDPLDGPNAAAAHSATVGAATPLPDRVMNRLWPSVLAALAEAGLAGEMLDLVHLRHELHVLPDGQPQGTGPVTAAPVLARAEGGLLVTVESVLASGAEPALRVVDRFFIRRTAVDPALPQAEPNAGPVDVVATPARTLGTLTITAPTRLETFAAVTGDANPIHRSDLLARLVGLPGRIVHGMWTAAAASRAVLEASGDDPSRLRSWAVDFVAPVLPGQQITTTVRRIGMRDGARVLSVDVATDDGTVALGTAEVRPPRTAYVFPGQGIQTQGMGMAGYERSAAARAVWEHADAITRKRLGFSILQLVRENPTTVDAVGMTYRHPAGVLHLTQFTQVAMATLASAQVAEMREAGIFDPDAIVAGHSVGEYTALAAMSDVLSLESAVSLVFARGQGMHGLVERDAQGRSDYRLAAIRPHLAGLSHAEADELVRAVAADTGELCEIVNHNLRGKQYAVAGTIAALEELSTRLGPGAPGRPPLLFVPGIDVPFHSSALLGGVADFREELRSKLPPRINGRALVGCYIPNLYPVAFRLDRAYVEGIRDVCGSVVLEELLADWEHASADPDSLARAMLVELLAWQFASPVRWIETFELLTAPLGADGLGVERIIEVGLGTAPTLANLAKGSLALPSHRGTRPEVLNVELDTDSVFEIDRDPEPEPEAPAEPAEARGAPATTAPAPAPATPAPAGAAPVADSPVDHATALGALLALRSGLRPEQLGADTIEDLAEGASSRRNQVLMDMGKEFALPAIDGAHEVPFDELAAKLAERAGGYRYPGPVLGAAVESALTAALGPRGASAAAVARRVTGHWGLGAGWVARTGLAITLGTREGASRRGGDLGTLAGATADALIDAAVQSAAAAAGVAVAPPVTAVSGGAIDAAAASELRTHFEDLLADGAQGLLTRLGRAAAAQDEPDHQEALARLALLESEHGPASLVAPAFDARRHVPLASATAWALADVDHLVQSSLAAEDGLAVDEDDLDALTDQIVTHRAADARITQSLQVLRDRAAASGRRATLDRIEHALTAAPTGVPVPGLAVLRDALPEAGNVLAGAARLAAAPGPFADQVALVTGASPHSIAWWSVAHLLRGGATVVVVTTTDTPERIAAYRDLERRYAGPGAQLHVLRANLASFADVDAVLDWITTPTMLDLGPVRREVKPALVPTLVLPFAAAPAGGQLPDTGAEAALTLRLLLLGVQRLVGRVAEHLAQMHADPATVILPMSPNHGTFGGDGAYGESKAALEAMLSRWGSESARWGAATRLIGAEIGWVRGTGLMAGNDALAAAVQSELGVTTFTAQQMGALIAALALPAFAEAAAAAPVRVDLTAGLAEVPDIAAALARVVEAGSAGGSAPAPEAEPTVAALPNLPAVLRSARTPSPETAAGSRARVAAEDMIVVVGIAEYGPLGASTTRWQAELGGLTAAGVLELAWRQGLIRWDANTGGWLDQESGDPVAEAEVDGRYRAVVTSSTGIRPFEDAGEVRSGGYLEFVEVFLDRPLAKTVASRQEAVALTAGISGAQVAPTADGWLVTLPVGASVRVPRTRPLPRGVGGQFPSGSDPQRLGLEAGVAASIDPLGAWNLVITAESFADAGVSPEELVTSVHPSLVGNTQGSGIGGMSSLRQLFMAPITGEATANDVLQETLSNVTAAHTNQELVGGYGPMVHPVAACATAAISLEEAVDKIRLGKAEIVVGGGWDDMSPLSIVGFADMSATADTSQMLAAGLVPQQHSRPGDLRRAGFVEAQGGGSFLVCRGSVALRLGLPVRAVVAYTGSFGDGIQTSIPAPGLGLLGAVRGGPDSPLGRALAELGLTADDITVVSKHDTSTEANDPNEAFVHATIQRELGRTPGVPLRVISQKALTGHAKGGAAAWQMAGVCDVFEYATVPGNPNLVSVDPRVCAGPLVVDYRPLRRREPVRAALITSLGFGHVAALVALAHPDVFVEAVPAEQRQEYQARARDRRVAGAWRRLAAMHGGEPLFARRTDRRLGAGSPAQLRDREAAMLVDAAGRLAAGGGA